MTGLDPGPAETLRVRTAAGAVLEADEVVCCAGRWVPELATMAGAACPVPLVAWDKPGATAPGLVVRVGPLASAGPVHLVHTPEVSLRPHSGGLLHLEAPDAAVDLHTPEPDLRRWAATLLRRAQQTVRGLIDARVEEFQVCVRPMPADGQSIVGRLPGAPGLYVAVTHSGVTLAAHLSRLIATELTTGTPPADLAPYRPARFLASPSAPATLAPPRYPSTRTPKFNECGVLTERFIRMSHSLVSREHEGANRAIRALRCIECASLRATRDGFRGASPGRNPLRRASLRGAGRPWWRRGCRTGGRPRPPRPAAAGA